MARGAKGKSARLLVALSFLACALGACDGLLSKTAQSAEHTFKPDQGKRLQASDGAEGSGCLPADALLPDGQWFGFIVAWDRDSVTFDPACRYAGAPANAKAAERGDEPPPNGFLIVNDDKATRRVEVAAGADAREDDVSDPLVDYARLRARPPEGCPGEWCGFWLYVNGGKATSLRQQYIP